MPIYQTTESCLIPEAGNYAFESVAMTGELVGVGQGFVPVLEKAPPMGNLGVVRIPDHAISQNLQRRLIGYIRSGP